jgi:hypothetical protein
MSGENFEKTSEFSIDVSSKVCSSPIFAKLTVFPAALRGDFLYRISPILVKKHGQ